jgi:hypothetical protein
MEFSAVPIPGTTSFVSKSSFCKLLVNEDQYSKLLEFCNGDLNAMKTVTGVTCLVSNEGKYFPGTSERVISLVGPLVQICVAVQLISEVFRICANAERSGLGFSEYALISLKLIVPNSVVGMIMGKGGRDVRSLAIDNSVRIQISKRIPGLLERMVSVAGRSDHVCKAAFVIVETIQADHRTCEHALTLEYASDIDISISSTTSPTAEESDQFQQMTKHLNELVCQLSMYPMLFAEMRNA